MPDQLLDQLTVTDVPARAGIFRITSLRPDLAAREPTTPLQCLACRAGIRTWEAPCRTVPCGPPPRA